MNLTDLKLTKKEQMQIQKLGLNKGKTKMGGFVDTQKAGPG